MDSAMHTHFGMKRLFLASLLAVVPEFTQPSVQTVAGGGPNNISAVNLALPGVWRLTSDGAGTTYVSTNSRIFRISPGGTALLVAGNGTIGTTGDGGRAVDAAIYVPGGLAVDPVRNLLFFSDPSSASKVRCVDLVTGIIVTYAGNGTTGTAGDGAPATSAQLTNPGSVALDSAGNLYIAETSRVRKVDVSTGIISVVAGLTTPGTAVSGSPAATSPLNRPEQIAVDPSNNVYIADRGSNRILKVAGGIITTFAGTTNVSGDFGDGGPAAVATLGSIYGVAANASAVYIADALSSRVRKITVGGSNPISHYAG